MGIVSEDIVMDHYSARRLSPKILAELKRLGCKVDTPEEVPEPCVVAVQGEQIAVPEAYRQFIEDVTWPKRELEGTTSRGSRFWMIEFLDRLQGFDAVDLGYDYPGVKTTHYLTIGIKDGGNYYLLLNLADPDPTSPRLFSVDHDPYQVRPLSTDTLLEVLRCFPRKDASEQVREYLREFDEASPYRRRRPLEKIGRMGAEGAPAIGRLVELLHHPDAEDQRKILFSTFANIGVPDERVVDALLDMLDDEPLDDDAFEQAIDTLCELASADERVAWTLGRCLRRLCHSAQRKCVVAKNLGQLGPIARPATSMLLAEVLPGADRTHPESAGWMSRVVQALYIINDELDEPPEVAFDLLEDRRTHDRLRADCARLLAKFMHRSDDDRVFEAFCALLEEEDHALEAKVAVVDAMTAGGSQDPKGGPRFEGRRSEIAALLVEQLDGEEGILIAVAARGLGRLGALGPEGHDFDDAAEHDPQELREKIHQSLPKITVALARDDAAAILVGALVELNGWVPQVLPAVLEACESGEPAGLLSWEVRNRRQAAAWVLERLLDTLPASTEEEDLPPVDRIAEAIEECRGPDGRYEEAASRRFLTVVSNDDAASQRAASLASNQRDEVRPQAKAEGNISIEQLIEAIEEQEVDKRRKVASHPQLPTETSQKLAADPDEEVRMCVAANPATAAPVLTRLAADFNAEVRRLAISSPTLPREVVALVDRLCLDCVGEPRESIASAGEVSEEDLRRLSDEAMGPLARTLAAQHPDVAPEALASMAEDPHWRVRAQVARHEATPPEALKVLSQDSNEDVLAAVAAHPGLNTERLEELYQSATTKIKIGVAANPNIAPKRLADILNGRDGAEVTAAAAGNPSISAEALERCTQNLETIKVGCVDNPHLCDSIRAELAKKSHPVRWKIAASEKTSPQLLLELKNDIDIHTRVALAGNPGAPPEVLAHLAREDVKMHHRTRVINAVAANPTLPDVAVEELANEGSMTARRILASRPSLPEPLMRRLARDYVKVRQALAARDDLPVDLEEALAGDPARQVRDAVLTTRWRRQQRQTT